MPVKLKVYGNEDDALLYWSVPNPIPECRGFAIERTIIRNGQQIGPAFLMNRTGFENEDIDGDTVEGQKVLQKPSTEWPFQRFSWTDHEVGTGDTLSYRVIPVIRDPAGQLQLIAAEQSSVQSVVLAEDTNARFQPYFNRGFVISQFVQRFMDENHLTPSQFKKQLGKHEHVMRQFLSGDLRKALLRELEIALAEGTDVFAALFELSDDELTDALCKLGSKAHVVLANGANKGPKTKDENEIHRSTLLHANVDVERRHRFIAPKPLGHNKFLVRMGKDGKPETAWTGSTNWAPTGLCTQVNNGLLIRDRDIAKIYFDQWQRLRNSGSLFPDDLMESNSAPHKVGSDVDVWFTRTSKGEDMAALTQAVLGAQEGVLFLMFMPGAAGLFSTVSALSGNPKLFVRGVVSELPNGRGDESAVDVNLIDGMRHTPMHLDIIQPEGVAHPMANFAAEVSHKQFISQVGHAIIHSKVVIVDPFSASPTVITGSHNFSGAASQKNDENFVIVRGDRTLAEEYAVNIMGAYAHYRFRAFLQQVDKPFNGLKDNDKWMAPKLKNAQKELAFFGV